ncbi:actin cytoskeleton and mitosis protein [Dispira parvispora]|uniref:Actin cytoskeleton and mitosis protein n=1 Tax=Dispira parvispora TaxID=1520584 RepID=A0A9W8AZI2_9FUNG|nr:actin cytoskeleton and mitosis protein [Dispira parvispora]
MDDMGPLGSTITASDRKKRFNAAMANNQYLELKDSREREREACIRQGLIPDPLKRQDLASAITLVGTCQDMCPLFEREEREYKNNVEKFEYIPGTKRIDPHRAVKAFQRSAAGKEQPLPSDVRPPPVLLRTLDYLMNEIVVSDEALQESHGFVRDRTRAIRTDFTLQNSRGLEAVEAHEQIARYHILCCHHMCGVPSFSMQQEKEQLGKVLQSLQEFYDDLRKEGTVCPNEAEFRAYHIAMNLFDIDMVRFAQFLSSDVFKNPAVQLVLRFHGYVQFNANSRTTKSAPRNIESSLFSFKKFFKQLGSTGTPYLLACLLQLHFNTVRRNALYALHSSVQDTRVQGYPLTKLVECLGFDDVNQAIQCCETYGVETSHSVVHFGRKDATNRRVFIDPAVPPTIQKHHRLVESKRNSLPFAAIVKGAECTFQLPTPVPTGGWQGSFTSATSRLPIQPRIPPIEVSQPPHNITPAPVTPWPNSGSTSVAPTTPSGGPTYSLPPGFFTAAYHPQLNMGTSSPSASKPTVSPVTTSAQSWPLSSFTTTPSGVSLPQPSPEPPTFFRPPALVTTTFPSNVPAVGSPSAVGMAPSQTVVVSPSPARRAPALSHDQVNNFAEQLLVAWADDITKSCVQGQYENELVLHRQRQDSFCEELARSFVNTEIDNCWYLLALHDLATRKYREELLRTKFRAWRSTWQRHKRIRAAQEKFVRHTHAQLGAVTPSRGRSVRQDNNYVERLVGPTFTLYPTGGGRMASGHQYAYHLNMAIQNAMTQKQAQALLWRPGKLGDRLRSKWLELTYQSNPSIWDNQTRFSNVSATVALPAGIPPTNCQLWLALPDNSNAISTWIKTQFMSETGAPSTPSLSNAESFSSGISSVTHRSRLQPPITDTEETVSAASPFRNCDFPVSDKHIDYCAEMNSPNNPHQPSILSVADLTDLDHSRDSYIDNSEVLCGLLFQLTELPAAYTLSGELQASAQRTSQTFWAVERNRLDKILSFFTHGRRVPIIVLYVPPEGMSNSASLCTIITSQLRLVELQARARVSSYQVIALGNDSEGTTRSSTPTNQIGISTSSTPVNSTYSPSPLQSSPLSKWTAFPRLSENLQDVLQQARTKVEGALDWLCYEWHTIDCSGSRYHSLASLAQFLYSTLTDGIAQFERTTFTKMQKVPLASHWHDPLQNTVTTEGLVTLVGDYCHTLVSWWNTVWSHLLDSLNGLLSSLARAVESAVPVTDGRSSTETNMPDTTLQFSLFPPWQRCSTPCDMSNFPQDPDELALVLRRWLTSLVESLRACVVSQCRDSQQETHIHGVFKDLVNDIVNRMMTMVNEPPLVNAHGRVDLSFLVIPLGRMVDMLVTNVKFIILRSPLAKRLVISHPLYRQLTSQFQTRWRQCQETLHQVNQAEYPLLSSAWLQPPTPTVSKHRLVDVYRPGTTSPSVNRRVKRLRTLSVSSPSPVQRSVSVGFTPPQATVAIPDRSLRNSTSLANVASPVEPVPTAPENTSPSVCANQADQLLRLIQETREWMSQS